jgi:hypothetical protein
MRVFVSHSWENSETAAQVARALQRCGIETWIDSQNLTAGRNWKEAIQEAMAQADGFVFFMGPSRQIDSHQHFDWLTASEGDLDSDPSKAVVPILIDDTPAPSFFRDRVPVRLRTTAPDYDSVAARVAHLLHHPSETNNPESYDRAKKAQAIGLEEATRFALSLKVAHEAADKESRLGPH